MDPLSVEGRLIESASKSGKLVSVRDGSALENTGTGTIYGRTAEGALARVDSEGGDISFLNRNRDMFIPSGTMGSVDMLSTKVPLGKDDILAPKTWNHYLRQSAPYVAKATGTFLGAWAGHIGTEGVKSLASGVAHLTQRADVVKHHDTDSSHNDVVSHESMQHEPSTHEVNNVGSGPHGEVDSFGHPMPDHHISGHTTESGKNHLDHGSTEHPATHDSTLLKHRINKGFSRLAVCDNMATRRFVEKQCAIFDERMRTLMDMARVSSPDCPNWPTSPNSADIELMARAVVAASNACQEAYAQRVARGEDLLPLQEIPLLEESFPNGPKLPDGRPLMSPMPSRPPPGMKVPNLFRKQEDYTEKERAEATFIMMAALAGAFVGSRTKYPILIGLIAALGAIAAAFVLAVDKQRQGENNLAGTSRS